MSTRLVCHKSSCYTSQRHVDAAAERMVVRYSLSPGQVEGYECQHHSVRVWHIRTVDPSLRNRHRRDVTFSYEMRTRLSPEMIGTLVAKVGVMEEEEEEEEVLNQ